MEVQPLWNRLTEELLPLLATYRRKLDRLNISIKDDSTLLTEADIAVEQKIVEIIRSVDPHSPIVAEEDSRSSERTDVLTSPERIWVIDPIDGTAQFVKPTEREYCSVICLVENLVPTAALIIAPELGVAGTPLVISTLPGTATASLNGQRLDVRRQPAKWISATRSQGSRPRRLESEFSADGYSIKTRTTSQTLDMVRTALDISPHTDLDLPSFALFFREKQKIWDGVAGLCLGQGVGLVGTDVDGRATLPIPIQLIAQATPTFESTAMGEPSVAARFFELIEK